MKKLVLIIVLTLFAFACAGLEKLSREAPASEEPEEPALRMYSGVEPLVLDPALIDVDEPGGSCGPLLFPGLTGVDQEGNPIPGLAESWESSTDGTRWTFHLREDVSWYRRITQKRERWWLYARSPATMWSLPCCASFKCIWKADYASPL